jgi:hypothetical protein
MYPAISKGAAMTQARLEARDYSDASCFQTKNQEFADIPRSFGGVNGG